MPEIRIVIADDEPMYFTSLRQYIGDEPSLRIVAEAQDGLVALDALLALKPDVAILDIAMPRLSGIQIVARLRKEGLQTKVIFLTVWRESAVFEAAVDLGVRGYLIKKDTGRAEVHACIRAVLADQCYASPEMITWLIDRVHGTKEFESLYPGLANLKPRERDILKRVARGQSSKEIATDVGIATRTVDVYRARIAKILGVRGPNVLRRFARQNRERL